MKSKVAGLLRGLLRQLDGREPSRPVAAAAPSGPVNPPPSAAPPPPKLSAPPTRCDEIEIALAPVIAGLPMELRARLMSVPAVGATLRLPAEMVVNQLAFGAVKISFGELRQLAPGIFANSGGEQDNRPIALPLGEILSRINPALLSRRPAQKIEVAEDIAGPFAERGRGFSFTSQPLKAPAAPPPPPPPTPAPEPVKPIAFTPPVAARQTTLPPMAPPVPPRAVTPAANGNGHVLPHPPISPRPTSPPTNGNNGNHGNGHSLALPPGLKLPSSDKLVPSAPAPSAPRPEPAQPTIFARLAALAEHWPAALKQEILPWAETSVPLAGSIIEPGLKRGRVVMTWKQIRTLALPSSSASPNDHLELELPLKVIAPLFLAAQKKMARPPSRTSVAGDIPDLFFGFPQPAPAPVAAPVPTLSKTGDTNYYALGEKGETVSANESGLRRNENPQTDFMSRQAHPKDVVGRAAAVAGVAGAVVAMQDGLRVASQVPADLNADTLAAFLPQIFDRVSQSTRELRMGALNNVSFTVGNIPWKIFKVNSVYFAAFGRAGEGLPSAQLAQLAADLDRKKQQ